MRDRAPYVGIAVLLAACKLNRAVLFFSVEEAGITLTSAPVSMRNLIPVVLSVTKNRRLFPDLPADSADANRWPDRFPPY